MRLTSTWVPIGSRPTPHCCLLPLPRSLVGGETHPWCQRRDKHRVFHISQLDAETRDRMHATLPWALRTNPKRSVPVARCLTCCCYSKRWLGWQCGNCDSSASGPPRQVPLFGAIPRPRSRPTAMLLDPGQLRVPGRHQHRVWLGGREPSCDLEGAVPAGPEMSPHSRHSVCHVFVAVSGKLHVGVVMH